jgi:hypothetical protein
MTWVETFPENLRWSNATQRAEIIAALSERGIDFALLAEQTGQLEADPFDLLCHLAFNAPLRSRRERAQRLAGQRTERALYRDAGIRVEVLDHVAEAVEIVDLFGQLLDLVPELLVLRWDRRQRTISHLDPLLCSHDRPAGRRRARRAGGAGVWI